jgi:hypothetical protein
MIRVAAALLVLLLALATSAEEWSPPRMTWGDPDLQGTWTNATITLLERPDEVEALVISAEEAREFEKEVANLYAAVDDVPQGELEAGEDVGGYNTFWMDPGKRLAVVRGEIRTSIITDPADGKLPYSLRGRAERLRRFWQLRKADDPETRLLGERCLVGFGSTGGPPMLPVLYNNHYQIVQSPGFVMILVEMNHNARIIRLDAPPRQGPIRPWLGDSVGRFDGQTLVVETTNFHPAQSFRVSLTHAVYMSKDAKVVERFTRVGEKEILYEFAVDDLENYKQVWRGEMPLLAANGRIYEYACHEGNYSLTNILAGERAKD